MDITQKRKIEHLELCLQAQIEFQEKTTLLEEVQLVHNALPELAMDQLDLTVTFLGKKLRFPFMIAAMTGGAEQSTQFNQALGRLAEKHGIAMGVGSQRVMHENPETTDTFCIREVAPSIALLGNIGIQEAGRMSSAAIAELVSTIGADGLALHLNPTMELIQSEGERNFTRGYEAIARIIEKLDVPLVVKETGAGISYAVAARLTELGVRWLDVGGAGGCCWSAIEALRTQGRAQRIGQLFREWGIPTAACVLALRDLPLRIIATGGIRDGLQAAKALALGAHLVGVALPFLKLYHQGGEDAMEEYLLDLIAGLKVTMMLTGSRTLEELRAQRLVIGPLLQNWNTSMRPAAAMERKGS